MPTSSDDTHKTPTRIAVPPRLPIDSSQPSVQYDPRPSVCPVFFRRPLLSEFSPSAPPAESSCPMTSDSRFCKGCSSNPFQIPRSIADPALLLPDCSSPFYRRPRLPNAKYRMVLLHPSDSSPCRLARLTSLHYPCPLRSLGFHRLPRYYGAFRPLMSLPYSRPRGS